MFRLASRLISAWPLVARRSLVHWKLLSSVVAGVLLAAAIMASTAIFLDALRDLALKHALNQLTDDQQDILATSELSLFSHDDYQRAADVATHQIDQQLAWLIRDRFSAVKTSTFYLTGHGEYELAGYDDNRAYFAFAPRLQEYSTLLPGGSMPRDGRVSPPGEALELEAIVPVEAAELFELSVGDRFSVVPTWPAGISHLSVTISGVFQNNDPEGIFSRLYQRALQAGVVQTVRALPLFLSQEAFLQELSPAVSDVSSTYAWLLDVVPERLNDANSSRAASDIDTAQSQVSAELGNFDVSTALLRVFDEYDERLFFTRAPMLVFLILMAIVILFYVVTLSSLLVERQQDEIALLRSRGANSEQVLAVFALEGGTVALLATVFGPLVAAAAVGALGFAPMFSDLTGSTFMAVEITRGAYIMSAVGGVLSFIALMVPAIQASRVGVMGRRRDSARPIRKPFYHRYYLDVLLLATGILLFRQLDEQGSVLGKDLLGELVVNELLLAIPGLILVATAMILLRLFPLSMDLASRALGRWLPAGLAMGLWQMAREPAHYARLMLLLILTAALGVFAASLVATLERSYRERVLYATGSDVRVEDVKPEDSRFRSTFADRYRRMPGIDGVSPVYRGKGFDISNPANDSFTVLGVDGETIWETAWSRDDFAREPLAELVDALAGSVPGEGLELPRGAVSLSVSLNSSRPEPNVYVSARVRDANDRYYSYRLGALGFTDFLGNVKQPPQRLGVALLPRSPSVEPLTLVSLGIHAVPSRQRLPRGTVLLDQITASTVRAADGRAADVDSHVVENFDSTAQWQILQISAKARSDELRDGAGGAHSASAMFSWAGDSVRTTHGIAYGLNSSSLAVLASQSFLDSSGYSLGDEFLLSLSNHFVRVRLEKAVEFFPTMNPLKENFLIADLTSLVRFANLDPIASEFQANEVWLSSDTTGVDRARLVDRLADEPFPSKLVDDRERRLADSQVDPLAKSGWSALLVLAFAAALITSAMGFLVHAYVSVRARQGQFALMRTIGFTLRQLLALVCLEQALLIAVGMALGTWMGGRLSSVMLPFLGHDDLGAEVVPPFIVEVDWSALAVAYSAMALVFAVVIAGVVLFIRRMSLQRMLRLGEE